MGILIITYQIILNWFYSRNIFSGSDAFDVCDVINGRPEHSPEFIEVPQVTVGEEGETVTFECQVLGYPLPTLDWYKVSSHTILAWCVVKRKPFAGDF